MKTVLWWCGHGLISRTFNASIFLWDIIRVDRGRGSQALKNVVAVVCGHMPLPRIVVVFSMPRFFLLKCIGLVMGVVGPRRGCPFAAGARVCVFFHSCG